MRSAMGSPAICCSSSDPQMRDPVDKDSNGPHCYRVRLPSAAEAYRIRGLEPPPARTINGIHYEAASEEPGPETFLCGSFGPPCFHCGGISEALCDFPLGAENRTCDRPLCFECAPAVIINGVDVDKNYCHDHDEHGRGMLLFPQPTRTLKPPGPPPRQRAKPLPKKPPESHRWRVRQGRGDIGSHGAVLTGWKTQIEARLFAAKVGGYVETWEEFVALWRKLYPLAERRPRSRR